MQQIAHTNLMDAFGDKQVLWFSEQHSFGLNRSKIFLLSNMWIPCVEHLQVYIHCKTSLLSAQRTLNMNSFGISKSKSGTVYIYALYDYNHETFHINSTILMILIIWYRATVDLLSDNLYSLTFCLCLS